jgi:hypothetical protein
MSQFGMPNVQGGEYTASVPFALYTLSTYLHVGRNELSMQVRDVHRRLCSVDRLELKAIYLSRPSHLTVESHSFRIKRISNLCPLMIETHSFRCQALR